MASMWRKAMLYLGLGPDDEYEDYDERPPSRETEPAASAPTGARGRPGPPRAPSRPERPRPASPPAETEGSSVRTIAPTAPAAEPPAATPPEPTAPKPRTVVRPVPAAARPHLVAPTSFNQAQDVADRFKASQPVILNLQGVDRELARRLIDFSSGLCYGLAGHMEKVAHQVYLLTPANVEVSADERRRLAERGLHDV
jgi:cell division inhibitor SepF